MKEGWMKLNTFEKVHQAELQKGFLEENGILAVVLNEKDSSYLIGEVGIYVREMDLDKAIELIKSQEN